jgi:8-oxo-dGTP diphosphatase
MTDSTTSALPQVHSKYPRPAVAVDLVLMSIVDGAPAVMLMRRDDEIGGGRWVLPGGIVRIDEAVDDTADRILRDKAQMSGAFIEQLYTFGRVDRDSRGRVISVAYFGLLPTAQFAPALAHRSDLMLARVDVPWSGESGGPVRVMGHDGELTLAFDHAEILATAILRLRGKLDYTAVGFALLPERFTLHALQHVHETILGTKLNKPAFRRRMLDRGWLEATGERATGSSHRPAELFRYKPR